jgi:hypothetical protein
MVSHLFSADERFAARGDGVRVFETNRQRVHVRFRRRVNSARGIKIEVE